MNVSAVKRGRTAESRVKWVLEKFGLLIALIVLGIVLSILSPIFLSPANLINVLRQIFDKRCSGDRCDICNYHRGD